MALVLIALDPGTDGDHCPAVMLDTDTGDLLFQGDRVTGDDQLAEVDRLSPIGPNEIVGRIPARMRGVILRALMEAENADAGADRIR
jgi:hypothetical protein